MFYERSFIWFQISWNPGGAASKNSRDLQKHFHSARPTRSWGFFWLSCRHYHKWCSGSSQAEILTLWRRRSFGEIRRLSWAKYHTQPFLDKRMSWPSAQEKEQNGLGNFFRTLTSEICHLQLGTHFHKRPAVLELGSLEKVASRSHHLQFHPSLPAASLVPTWRDPLYVRWSRREILRAITECNSSGNFNLGWKQNRHQC